MRRKPLLIFVITGVLCGPAVAEFVHPGLTHSGAALEFVRAKVAAGSEPWKTAWERLRSSDEASLAYRPEPYLEVVRGVRNNPDIGSSEMSDDSAAAYAHALQWCVVGEAAHAAKAIEILNGWSSTLESVSGHDAKLLVGMDGIKFCSAAELIRHTGAGWSGEDQDRFERMLREVFYPVIEDFYPSAIANIVWIIEASQLPLALG